MTNNRIKTKFPNGTFWSFGLVNKRLAEIFFNRKDGKIKLTGHAFVKRGDYKTKQEEKWIREETKRVKLSYHQGKYIWVKEELGKSAKLDNGGKKSEDSLN